MTTANPSRKSPRRSTATPFTLRKGGLPSFRKGLDSPDHLAHRGDLGNLSVAQRRQLGTEVSTGRFESAAMARAFIRDTFGKVFSLGGVRKLLHRLRFSFHKS